MVLAVTLYFIFVAVAAFAPLKWSIIAMLLLSTIDFPGQQSAVGILNACKGTLLPLYLLWRLRGYSGHTTVIVAPLAWSALVIYAAIAGFWSIFPMSAFKLVGHMAGSLVISFVLVRATKGGYLSQKVLVPVTAGALTMGMLCFIFQPAWSDEVGRFTSFMPAQGFASFLGALFCLGLCSQMLRTQTRILVCLTLATALVFNGSRIWFMGILLSTLIALLISDLRPWLKACVLGVVIIGVALASWESKSIVEQLSRDASSNRIVAALSASYQGETGSWGLGTLNFRRNIGATAIERIQESSLPELILGHGTSNAAIITGSLYKGYSGYGDPNRMLHNEWLRVLYEWGIIGSFFWCMFVGSVIVFAWEGVRNDIDGNSKALFAYLPPFVMALAGENFLAGAGSAISVGFLLLVGLASITHRQARYRRQNRVNDMPAFEAHHPARAFSSSAG